MKEPADTSTGRTGEVYLQCEVSGKPTPRVVWKKNGKLVANDSRHFVKRNALRITRFLEEDVGVYMCVAWNEYRAIASLARISLIGGCCRTDWLLTVAVEQNELRQLVK